MQRSQQSREFSGRVEVNSHQRGDFFRRNLGIVSLLTAALFVGWLFWNAAAGSPEIYQAGALSTAHHGLANRCEACHDTFAPWRRLVSLGTDELATAAPDQKCMFCHEGAGHYFEKQEPGTVYEEKATEASIIREHRQACSDCHSEHQDDQDLKRVANHFCVECHADLNRAVEHVAGIDMPAFHARITDFSDHPEFALKALVTEQQNALIPPSTHGALSLIRHMLRPKEPEPRWQDQTDIEFNHAKHLKPEGLPDAAGKVQYLGRDCSYCHKPDADRKGMQPISFKQHCQSCHPLLFEFDRVKDTNSGELVSVTEVIPSRDRSRYELLQVPHRQLDVVRGYLTDFYAIQELEKQVTSSPERKRPGYSNLDEKELDAVESAVKEAEKKLRSGVFEDVIEIRESELFNAIQGLKTSGGCGFCHTVEDLSAGKNPSEASGWRVRPPKIPNKWFLHADFDHDAHRFIERSDGDGQLLAPSQNCKNCHTRPAPGHDILESESTGDVLLPEIDVCRKCHSDNVTQLDAIPARTDCVECHTYHKREFETGTLEQLPGSANHNQSSGDDATEMHGVIE